MENKTKQLKIGDLVYFPTDIWEFGTSGLFGLNFQFSSGLALRILIVLYLLGNICQALCPVSGCGWKEAANKPNVAMTLGLAAHRRL